MCKENSPVRGQAQDGPAPGYGQSCSRGGGEGAASTELNYSIILAQEKHLSVCKQRVQAVLFCTATAVHDLLRH